MTATFHHKNRHKNGYDFKRLCLAHPRLKSFIIQNKYTQQATIDFSNNDAVIALNCALLKSDYEISQWNIPLGYLCPPIPGRVDYIHYLADLLEEKTKKPPLTPNQTIPTASLKPICVLDIGTGASCIYPILGQREYGWHFIATDIDPLAIQAAKKTINANEGLSATISPQLQKEANNIFKGIIEPGDFYHLTMCNPPFHKSLKEALQGNQRKWQNLNKNSNVGKNTLNFGGQKAELWCDGGELAFIQQMIKESRSYQLQVLWFTCLVSQKDNLRAIKFALKKVKANQVEVIKMAQGHKISRFVAWTFQPKKIALINGDPNYD